MSGFTQCCPVRNFTLGVESMFIKTWKLDDSEIIQTIMRGFLQSRNNDLLRRQLIKDQGGKQFLSNFNLVFLQIKQFVLCPIQKYLQSPLQS